MDTGKIKKLNPYHVFFLAQNTIIGIGLLSLPHDLSAIGYGLWVIPILLALAVQATLFPMGWLGSRYPNDSLFDINQKLLGKWLGNGINVLVISYAIIALCSVAEGYVRLMQSLTLSQHKIYVPLLLLFAVVIYVVLGGIKSVARFCMLGFFFTAWMIYFLQWTFLKGEWSHLYPLFAFSFSELKEASHQGFRAMLGYELLMIYFPYIIQQKKAIKHASYGIWLSTFFYLLVCLASLAYFSKWQLENLTMPVLNIFQAVELTFVERIEHGGLSIWVFLIISTTSAYLWAAKKGLNTLLEKDASWHIFACAFVAIFIILGPIPDAFKQKMYHDWLLYLGYGLILYPNLLLALHWLSGIRRRNV
jgi:spore germination protein AB